MLGPWFVTGQWHDYVPLDEQLGHGYKSPAFAVSFFPVMTSRDVSLEVCDRISERCPLPRKSVPFRSSSRNAVGLSPVGRTGGQRLAMESVSVVSFGAKVQVGEAELLRLAEEQVAAGFKIKMEALDERGALRAG